MFRVWFVIDLRILCHSHLWKIYSVFNITSVWEYLKFKNNITLIKPTNAQNYIRATMILCAFVSLNYE